MLKPVPTSMGALTLGPLRMRELRQFHALTNDAPLQAAGADRPANGDKWLPYILKFIPLVLAAALPQHPNLTLEQLEAGLTLADMSALIGTDYVPMDGLAMLHRGEKVIPASKQGPGYSGGGDGRALHVHTHVTIQTMDSRSFGDSIDRHSHVIETAVKQALKRFAK